MWKLFPLHSESTSNNKQTNKKCMSNRQKKQTNKHLKHLKHYIRWFGSRRKKNTWIKIKYSFIQFNSIQSISCVCVCHLYTHRMCLCMYSLYIYTHQKKKVVYNIYLKTSTTTETKNDSKKKFTSYHQYHYYV